MANIQYIKTMTSWATFNDSAAVWTRTLPTMPNNNPDICNVRGITFIGRPAEPKMFLLWCSLTNDYIGIFNSTSAATQLGMQIMLNSPVPNSLTFQLHVIDQVTNTPSMDSDVFGNIAIQLEFIKYKDVPLHA